jgi:alkaline phosphatase
MDADIDRHYFHPTQPSIAEMTAKAIELLSQDKDGFFLMVEGSQVDWAGHNNDPIYMVTDFLAFDDAVKVAVDFAEEDGKTLVLAYPDHNTGGMKIGHYYTSMPYTATTIEDLIDPLKGMKITSGGLVGMMTNPGEDAELISAVKEWWGLDITQDDVDEIRNYSLSSSLNYALAAVISKNYTVVGWTTHGHNGETVPVWVAGKKAEAPVGTIDNTELAFMAADAMDVKLHKATEKLYVDLDTVTDDYEIVDDGLGNLTVLVAGAQIPVSKDYMITAKGKTIELPGITVYAPATGKVYISKKAVNKL